jgi:hypothetical protein
MLDEMELSVDTLFENFLKLVGTGIASEDARKRWMTGSHNVETNGK